MSFQCLFYCSQTSNYMIAEICQDSLKSSPTDSSDHRFVMMLGSFYVFPNFMFQLLSAITSPPHSHRKRTTQLSILEQIKDHLFVETVDYLLIWIMWSFVVINDVIILLPLLLLLIISLFMLYYLYPFYLLHLIRLQNI